MNFTSKLTRCLLLVVALIGGLSVNAATRLYMNDFTIDNYDVKNVDVMLDVDVDNLFQVQGYIKLPKGLVINGEMTWNDTKIPVEGGTIMRQARILENNDGSVTVKMDILNIDLTFSAVYPEGSYPVLTLPVQAAPGMLDETSTGTVNLYEIKLSTTESVDVAESLTSTATVSFEQAAPEYSSIISCSNQPVIINPGDTRTARFDFSSNVPQVAGWQADFYVPEGVELLNIQKDPRLGSAYVSFTDNRATKGFYRLIIMYMTGYLQSNNGPLFSFDIKVSDDFDGNGQVKMQNVFISNRDGKSITAEGRDFSIVSGKVALDQAQQAVQDATAYLDALKSSVVAECPLVGANYDWTPYYNMINAVSEAVQTAYADYTLTPNLENIVAPLETMRTQADAFAQTIRDAENAEMTRRAENQTAYNNTLAEITALQTQLDQTNATIEAEYPDYKDEAAAAAVQTMIDNATAAAQAAYEAVANAGTYDYTLDKVAIQNAIQALLTAAQDKKTESDRVAANQAAYNADIEVLDNLQNQLNQAKAAVIEQYPDYVDTAAEDAIQTKINNLRAAVEAAYAAVTESGNYNYDLDTESISAEIAELLPAAAERKRVATNQAAYNADIEALNNLQTQLNQAKAEVLAQYPDYVDAEAEDAIQTQINNLRSEVEAAYSAVVESGNYDYDLNTESISVEIAELLPAAAERQRVATNEAAYNNTLTEIAALQTQLDQAKATIESDYPGYADAEAAAAVQTMIDNVRAAAQTAYEAVATEGSYEYTFDKEAIQNAIQALITAAQDKQTEAERVAANQAAYNADIEALTVLQNQLDDAKAEVLEQYPDYVDTEAEDAIQAQIDNLRAAVEAAYAAVAESGNYDYNLDTESVSAEIAALLPAAAERERVAYNEAEYQADLNDIATLLDLYNSAMEEIRVKNPEYADSEACTSVLAQIEAAKNDADAEYARVQEEGRYSLPSFDFEQIQSEIDAMLANCPSTGITLIFGEELPADAEIYTMDGVRHAAPVAGQINIIRYKDNTIKKVIVK